MSKLKYTGTEMMIIAASRLIEDGKTVFTGTGIPILAALLAKATHAPRIAIIYEAGGMCPETPPTIPLSVGDSMTTHRAIMAASMDYVMSFIQAGYGEFAFLGAAQIDMYGNINTTVIGPYDKPKVRLPGSGGANDFGSLCWRTIIIMRQDRKRFVRRVDFITTPGYLTGPMARERVGLPRNTGPWRVVTQLGVYGFDEEKRMTLLSIHPGVTLEEINENSGFPIRIPDEVEVTLEPTNEELKILRSLDPYGVVLRK
ncbi:MAG: 3-oxoacid CoA-transferase [Candidatus Nezhaarchaeota archaeon]|nr:3-oxoacid CoA-transferase [Candidatus Nezhaarchaeota archaeon]MCX8142250.1 3-oxoacid CoA-transferase [Candidatus Nezhaarchaeota archaeon]MDW8050777.1 CoA-transferase [Nitrososphaerota archaeon]